MTYRNGAAAVGGSLLAKAANTAADPVGLSSAPINAASTPAQTAAVGTVMGMCGDGDRRRRSGNAEANDVEGRSDVR